MKANELRVGNWVKESDRLVHIHDGFGIDHAHNFDPIPLTEEWLVKLGFKKINDNLFRLGHLQYRTGMLKKGSTGYNSCFMFGVKKITHIRRVHQLQNLYFALTGTELTIK